MLGPGTKWIINYPDILDKWPMRCGTSLTQAEVTSLELKGFVLEDGVELVVPPIGPINDVSPSHDPLLLKALLASSQGMPSVLHQIFLCNLFQVTVESVGFKI